ncbi:MAG: type III pantothenate kinase [Deltaproteobacteria bacterium]|nr:type III pantothenate kinase [Deltaproteobacteria bacterium]
MLLTVDIGNTNTVLGLFDGSRLVDHWRIATSEERTSDEYAIALHALFELSGVRPVIDACILASVVPDAVRAVLQALKGRFGVEPLQVGPGLKTGMPILYENPKEVGADRIVNGVAAYERYRSGVIVVDFGTATTFDCVSPHGEYLGGVIAPGVTISADALYRHAAKLPRVEVARPARVVGRNTVASMQSGLFYGYVGLVDGVVTRMVQELDFTPRVMATGGLARLIAASSSTIEETDELLTLTGLRILFERNRAA